jgi:flagellar basal-body rod modification protein FlgD
MEEYMMINSINSTAATDTAAKPTTTTTGVQKGADRDTFLKLLVAQLKNQDPLAPQDGAAFVAQLAQFSSLDQLIGINQQLGDLLANQSSTPAK